MKHHPHHRSAGVRFSQSDAARARREVERQHATERAWQRLWEGFLRRRAAEQVPSDAPPGEMARRAA